MSETETSNSPFDVIHENRKSIFLAEIGASIHDLGKLSEEFLLETVESTYFRHHLVLRRNVSTIPSGLHGFCQAKNRLEALKLYFGSTGSQDLLRHFESAKPDSNLEHLINEFGAKKTRKRKHL